LGKKILLARMTRMDTARQTDYSSITPGARLMDTSRPPAAEKDSLIFPRLVFNLEMGHNL
jgi:hypothetical protein